MYEVLIAEDEMLVRLGLKNSINWEKFGMHVLADAQDGQSAWEIYEKNRPDILITDIRMPIMDGMELIRKIRENDKATKILILTCVEQFDLVRQAMSLGVSDYILKLTMTTADIESVLLKVQSELDQSGHEMGETAKGAEKDALNERILKGYIFYNLFCETEFQNYIKLQHLQLRQDNLLVCVMEIDNYEKMKTRFQDNKGDIVKISLLNVLNEILESSGTGVAFHDSDEYYVILINLDGPTEKPNLSPLLITVTDTIRNLLSIYFDASVTFGISNPGNQFASLKALYEQAINALRHKFYQGYGRLYTDDAPLLENAFQEKLLALQNQSELAVMLSEKENQAYNQRIDEFAKTLKTKEQIKEFFIQLLQGIAFQINSAQFANLSDAVTDSIHQIAGQETLDGCIGSFREFIISVHAALIKKQTFSREITEALRYIRNHYEKNITLNQVARQVNLSAGYFSNLFKKEVQENFVGYLNNLRIEQAKNLLQSTNLKAYEVAEKVGFTETTYFCKVFKKTTGMSPNEFRKS
ncbi:MAG: response regulator [Clostridiaceae bacterium]|nr:response regulator [Clostridiaceae bacterium]